jgi:hypothetical protein
MKNLLIFVLFIAFSYFSFSDEIISTLAGGNWNESKTWVNGVVPGNNSDVVIKGNVTATEIFVVKNLLIEEKGRLELNSNIKNSVSIVDENTHLKGKLIVGENCELKTSFFIKDPNAKNEIQNYGIIQVGK